MSDTRRRPRRARRARRGRRGRCRRTLGRRRRSPRPPRRAKLHAPRPSALATASLAQKRAARCMAGPRLAAGVGALASVKSRSASRGRRSSARSRRSTSRRSMPTPLTAAKSYSTVTVFARLRGWSTFRPRARGDVVRQQLQRDDRQHRLEQPVGARDRRRPPRRARRRRRALGGDRHHVRAARPHLGDVRDHLVEHRRVGGHADHRRVARPAARSARASSRRPRRRRSGCRRSPSASARPRGRSARPTWRPR